ncbi:MAG: acyl CoA--acetate/3-ketoacid CoA transferase subunit alpha, partial [Nevskiales bacterium]
FARAADRTYLTTEELVDQIASDEADAQYNLFERSLVTGVVESKGGAHPTSNASVHGGGYGWDVPHIKRYCEAAVEDEGWNQYVAEFLTGDEAAYQTAVGGHDHIVNLPRQVF